MRAVTGTEMRQIDQAAIEEHDIAGLTLMENAGKAVANRANAVLAGIGAPPFGDWAPCSGDDIRE
jgi:NAD(P)H-hydrate repair Nnr-like enzyme with NAD(P)H-hydrate epimerase domain